jgi:hypothetical protein
VKVNENDFVPDEVTNVLPVLKANDDDDSGLVFKVKKKKAATKNFTKTTEKIVEKEMKIKVAKINY